MRPVGEAILTAQGMLTRIEQEKSLRQYKRMFEAKQILNECMRDLLQYRFDPLNYVEQTIWLPKYTKLLKDMICNTSE